MKISKTNLTRRQALKTGAAAAAVTAASTGMAGKAFAGSAEDAIIKAAKAAVPGGQDITGIIWSNYQVALSGPMQEFGKATGIDLKKIQDISTFEIPQRAMAEALSKSPEFDISSMSIPT